MNAREWTWSGGALTVKFADGHSVHHSVHCLHITTSVTSTAVRLVPSLSPPFFLPSIVDVRVRVLISCLSVYDFTKHSAIDIVRRIGI